MMHRCGSFTYFNLAKGVVLMGYYNDGPTKRKGGGWLLPIIIGLAVGVLLMLVIYPNLSGNNVALNDAPEEQSTSEPEVRQEDRKSTRLNSSHVSISS